MKWLLTLLNIRTFVILVISVLACTIILQFNIRFNHNFLLLSLVIAFPLIFSLRSAFRRRERALEYLSLFRAGILMVWQCFQLSKKLSSEGKTEIRRILEKASDALVDHLKTGTPDLQGLNANLQEISLFIQQHMEEISSRILLRVIRLLEDVHEASSFLASLKRHSTMVAIRYLILLFFNMFPFLQAGVLYTEMDGEYPRWLLYVAVAFTSLVLITFYNIQAQIEKPFDQVGLDDIQLEDFRSVFK